MKEVTVRFQSEAGYGDIEQAVSAIAAPGTVQIAFSSPVAPVLSVLQRGDCIWITGKPNEWFVIMSPKPDRSGVLVVSTSGGIAKEVAATDIISVVRDGQVIWSKAQYG